MAKHKFKEKKNAFAEHRNNKHLNHRVNGETEQTLSEQITQVQARKRS
ncbi:YpzG family protein [Halobacillus litoralis]|nr:YpzG family protein [Halobacillus litoralis]MCA0971814.1 YpzG family protein [Halobacillus litoralis]